MLFSSRPCVVRSVVLCVLMVPLTLAPSARATEGSLVIVGGGKLTDSIIGRFVDLAGGEKAHLVVIPTASSDKGLPMPEATAELWTSRGIGRTSLLHSRSQQRANDDEFVSPLRNATAVWIGGGQQSRLAAAYSGTKVQAELSALLARGGVIGGTSAGAACLSSVMIESGNPVPVINKGLSLLPGAIIDQHFLQRNRTNRLMEAIDRNPKLLGIGIDESTAVLIEANVGTVLGESFVTLVSGAGGQRPDLKMLTRGSQFSLPETEAPTRRTWAIALHGGAGTVSSDASEEEVTAWRAGLRDALKVGQKILKEGGDGLDAVEQTIRVLEDNPRFNAGRGAVFNSAGGHELDASIMDGRTLDGGAVAGVSTVRNPIGLARLVMSQTRHVLLAGPGAEQFATEENVPRVENTWFSTERRRKSWQRVKAKEKEEAVSRFHAPQAWRYGTVGCVVLDQNGDLAAGTSTGGLTNKKFGRVGDSPILGAGTYADNETCAVSATGTGEQFIRHTVAAQISQLMRHRSWSLKQAAEYVLHKRLNPGDGGVIAVDHLGNIEWVFTSPGMFRGAADSQGRFEIRIRDEK